MKKLFIIVALCAAIESYASVTLEGSKFSDNWSLGIAGGIYTPLKHHAFFGSMRPSINLTIAKQLTPVYALGIEGATAINTTTLTGIHSKNAFDMVNINLLNMFNLSNFFGGYKGEPRTVELVAIYGLGWGHLFMTDRGDRNFATSKAGLNININLGESKAWQVNIKPTVLWNLEGGHCAGSIEERNNNVKYNANFAAFELTAGVTYKFSNSYGAHNFTFARLYDQGEIDGLNAKINDLRKNVSRLNSDINEKNQTIKQLQAQLDECRNKVPEVVTRTETKTDKELESVVTFRQGKSVIDNSQLPNVERIATYLKNHPSSRVVIKGYASPEGSAEINAKIANDRANAVKNVLINKYRISTNRIEASGQGVGNMFSEPDWNRVSISTIQQ